MTAVRERPIFRSAYNPAAGTANATVWPKNTLYVFPTVASTMTLYSTSTADTSQLVLIDGLDANYDEISEVVMLNGQTGRATTQSFFRINNMTVLTDSPQGDISIGTGVATAGVPTNTYGFIPHGDNMDASGVYTVPNGWTQLEIPSKTDIYTNAYTSSNTALVAITFNGTLNKNSLAS
jgi:hypothetical protein